MSEKKPGINYPVSRFIPVLRPNSCHPKEKPGHHEEGSWNTIACIQKCSLHPFLKRSTVIYSTTQAKSLSLEHEGHNTCVQAENRLLLFKFLLKNNPKWQQWGNVLPTTALWAIHLFIYFEWTEKVFNASLMGNVEWLASLLVRTMGGEWLSLLVRKKQFKDISNWLKLCLKAKSVRIFVSYVNIHKKQPLKKRHEITEPQGALASRCQPASLLGHLRVPTMGFWIE